MRARTLFAAGISAAALVISGLAGAATASSPDAAVANASALGATVVSGTPTSFPNAKCGTSEGTWAQDGFTAQDGAPTNPGLNTWGGKRVKCNAKFSFGQVVVDGYPNQSIDIDFNIEVYKNIKVNGLNQPNDAKKSVCSYSTQAGTYEATGVTGAQWTIDLNKKCKIGKKDAKKSVWVAVQASLDQAFGQWFWAVQSNADVSEGDWADTGNLFQLGCESFTAGPTGADKLMQACLGQSGKPDYIMVLN